VRLRVVRAAAAAASSSEERHPADANSRRLTLLAGLAGVGAAASLAGVTVQAASAAAQCDLTASSSGLQFCELAVGAGTEPSKGSLIRCHYSGRLVSNGRVFDSSYERGRPLTFKVGVREVIQGAVGEGLAALLLGAGWTGVAVGTISTHTSTARSK
jgi:peptidylprolyl isomerase